ncbi:MAG: hypothetical protein GF331_02755 [Chitinivibrionales bacterium]|nr:hypothetical protein [Chitinivibrionales bacterium]
MILRVVPLALLLSMCSSASGRHVVGSICGQKVFFREENTRIDTLGWDKVEQQYFDADSSKRRRPEQAVAAFEAHGKRIYRLRELSAIGAAILQDLGFDVVLLSQWVAQPSQYINPDGPSSRGDSYQRQRIVSDYLWERLSGAELERPSELAQDLQVTLRFARDNRSTVPGKQLIVKHAMPLVAPGEAVVLSFVGGTSVETFFKRRPYRAYLIAPAELSVKKIIARIEGVMDKLKLDLSYTVPEIEALE